MLSKTPPMPCMPRPIAILQMHTVVEHPLTSDGLGRIYCHPLGQEPIEYTWKSSDGSNVAVTEYGNEAYDLPVGLYRITAVDAGGSQAYSSVTVQALHPDAVVIREYRTTSASTSVSRDGTVEAIGTNLDTTCRFVWTNGVETKGPLLKDVPPGKYAAIYLPDENGVTFPIFVHTAPPAEVLGS